MKADAYLPPTLRAAFLLLGSLYASLHIRTADAAPPRYAYGAWSGALKTGACVPSGLVPCVRAGGVDTHRFPPGIFEIDEQLLVLERTTIVGARNPNDARDPTRSPAWSEQTTFLATRGVTDYAMVYCHAADMVRTRVGFVLSSHVTVANVSYQGIDVIRPDDNGALCGGGAFETKGCAENDCSTAVNNGGSDGLGSVHVTIENVRLNDLHFAEDAARIGAVVPGNYDCRTGNWSAECCFCKPNGVRSTQVGVWVPATRNDAGTAYLSVRGVVSRSSQADGINLHGFVTNAVVENVHFEHTGDDTFALWGGDLDPANVTFRSSVAVNPGILRPNWYGNCVATYGLRSVVFEGLSCRAPTLLHPLPQPGQPNTTQIGTSMFVFYTSFGGTYPAGNRVVIRGWSFEDLDGTAYTPAEGTMGDPGLSGKKVWSRSDGGVVGPFFLPSRTQRVNVVIE